MVRNLLIAVSLCWLTAAQPLQSQPHAVKNLVFEGAGIRGIAYCGALKELEAAGLIKGVERVGGTSAGAITALAVSLGYSADEIEHIIAETNFKKFNDGRFLFAGGINRMSKYFGWYRGQRFSKWLEKMIATKTINPDITFRELHQNGFKDLYITATCLNTQQLVILSRETYPDMPVKDAVRISMSIPLYFEAVFIDSTGRTISRPKDKNNLNIMVDGGLTGNFPIKIFDSSRYVNGDAQNHFVVNASTMGFRIDREEQIKNDRQTGTLAPMQVRSFKEYTGAFYNMVIENLNRQTLSADDWKRTVSISDGKMSPRIRKLSSAETDLLIQNGQRATREYLHGSNPLTAD